MDKTSLGDRMKNNYENIPIFTQNRDYVEKLI